MREQLISYGINPDEITVILIQFVNNSSEQADALMQARQETTVAQVKLLVVLLSE